MDGVTEIDSHEFWTYQGKAWLKKDGRHEDHTIVLTKEDLEWMLEQVKKEEQHGNVQGIKTRD